MWTMFTGSVRYCLLPGGEVRIVIETAEPSAADDLNCGYFKLSNL
jgi:hypothetical protein